MAILSVNNKNTGAPGALAATAATGTLDTAVSSTTTIPYTPIGFGKPLLAEILTIYAGTFKAKGLFKGNKRDLLCVSAAKASETFDASPRAINLLQQNVVENTFLEFEASAAATPYIYYKDAVTDNTIDITIELTASAFDEHLFSTVADVMEKAAGMPVFMPAAGKLLAGARFVNIVQSGANDLLETSPFLSETITIRFDTAGMPVNTAQSMMICRDEDQAELSAYQVETVLVNGSARMQLTNHAGVYNGPSPYLIINLDGASRPDLSGWTATAASSAVLSTFYGDNTGTDAVSETLQQAMGLYNDYTCFTKAMATARQLQGMQPNNSQYSFLLAQYQAYANNVRDPAFTAQLPKIQ